VVRRGLLYAADPAGIAATSLGTALALRLLARGGVVPGPDPSDPGRLRLGAATIPPLEPTDGAYGGIDARGFQVLLDYSGGRDPFRNVSIRDALDRRVPATDLEGRIVLVAVTADSVRDDFRTPLGGGFTYGVLIHAQTAAQLLRMADGTTPPTRFLPDAAEVALILAAGLAGSFAGLAPRGAALFAATAAAGAAALSLGWLGALLAYLWVPAAGPLAAWLASLGLASAYLSWRERADREALMQLFSIHVAAPVARELWLNREAFMAGGRPTPRRLTATVLFSDIAGFTPVSERLDPETLNTWLHAYMDAMVPIIHDHGGLIMSFLGDGIFAVFGVPVPRTAEAEIDRDAVQAVRAALAMEPALDALNRRWAEAGLPPVSIRVGIHTGSLMAGSIGGAGHMEYTLIGDVVNTAARLEAIAKSVGDDHRPIRIVVGAPTWDRLGDAFRGRPVGEVALKGKDQRVAVHLILGARSGAGKDTDPEPTGEVMRLTPVRRGPPDIQGPDAPRRPCRKGSLE
jgi:adenylate cyclase